MCAWSTLKVSLRGRSTLGSPQILVSSFLPLIPAFSSFLLLSKPIFFAGVPTPFSLSQAQSV